MHHSGHTYPTRLCVAQLQPRLNSVSCIFPAVLLRSQHAPGCVVVRSPPVLSIFKEPKLILAQMMPNQEGLVALIRPSTCEEQPPPWVLLVLCPSRVLSGLLCWRLRPPALKGNVSSAQNSLTKQVQLFSDSVVVHSLRPHGLSPTWLLCPWDSPGKDTGVDFHSLSRGSSRPRYQNCICCIGMLSLCRRATWEASYLVFFGAFHSRIH